MTVKFSRDKSNSINVAGMKLAVRRHIDFSRTTLLATVSALACWLMALRRMRGRSSARRPATPARRRPRRRRAMQAAQQQAEAAQRSQAAMSRAVTALRAVQTMQAAAHAAALNTSTAVPNGLAPGGPGTGGEHADALYAGSDRFENLGRCQHADAVGVGIGRSECQHSTVAAAGDPVVELVQRWPQHHAHLRPAG